MRVLITGVSGFAGQWLAWELAARTRHEIFGLTRQKFLNADLPRRVHRIVCDLNNRAALTRILKKIRPDRVHHLAGQASVFRSWADRAGTRRDNVGATRNLLAALDRAGLTPVFHLAGSAEVYGRKTRKIRESAGLSPRNPYARSKRDQERLVCSWSKRTGAPAVITRAFNHAGPGQKDIFVLSDFARQIARIEAGRAEPVLRTGNLSAVRDFTDVRDVARAYRLCAETSRGLCVYNVASGKGRTVGSVVRKLVRLSRVPVRVLREASRMRPVDVPELVGDPRKIRHETGWRAEIPLERTLRDLLNYWRDQQ